MRPSSHLYFEIGEIVLYALEQLLQLNGRKLGWHNYDLSAFSLNFQRRTVVVMMYSVLMLMSKTHEGKLPSCWLQTMVLGLLLQSEVDQT